MTEPWARLPDNPRAAGELPAIDRIAFEFRAGRSTEVDGKATAGAQVVLLREGERIGETVARADGTWRLMVERGLGVGDHRLQVTSQRPGGGDERLGDAVRVSVPSTLTGPVVVMFGAVPDAASNIPARGIDGGLAPMTRVAQAKQTPPAPLDGALNVVRDWLERADRSYQDVVVKRLSAGEAAPPEPAAAPPKPAPNAVIAQTQPPAVASPKPAAPAPTGTGSVLDGVVDWLKRSSDVYQNAIVKRLTEPGIDAATVEARRKTDEARRAADAKAGEDAQEKARADLRAAQAQRDAELKAAEAASKAAETSSPKAVAAEPKATADDAAAKQAAEDRRIADETLKRQADLQAAEEKRVAEAKKAADEAAARKQAEDKRQADLQVAEEKRVAEAKKAADEAAARKQAEDKRQAELQAAEEKRVADAKKAADEAAARKLAEERRLAEEAAQRAATEAKRAADLAREAEARRQADLKATEETRKAEQATAAAKRAAEQKAADETRRRAIDLAEAASKVQVPDATKPGAAPAGTAAKSGAKAVAEKPAVRSAAAIPPRRAGPPIDSRSRSSLGAGHQAAAIRPRVGDGQCRLAGRRIKPPGYYIVQEGDSLWDIADLHYNDGAHFERIERANRNLEDPDLIRPCQRLFIPAPHRG